jgi:hypothetical protein
MERLKETKENSVCVYMYISWRPAKSRTKKKIEKQQQE